MSRLEYVEIEALDTGENVRQNLGDLDELTSSMEDLGVVLPVRVVERSDHGLLLVAGHRRVAAAQAAGLEEVPALVSPDPGDAGRVLLAMVENLQRLDLDPIDEAVGYERLVEAGWSATEVAERLGRSKGHVSRRRALLRLPASIQTRIRTGEVRADTGYQVSQLVGAVPDEDLAGLVDGPAQAIRERQQALKSERRVAAAEDTLRDDGVHVVEEGGFPWQSRLDVTGLDPDEHRDESCHAAYVQPTPWDKESQVQVVEGCVDLDRHQEDSDAPMEHQDLVTEQEATLAAERVERQTVRTLRQERYREIGGRFASELDDDEAVGMALRVIAYNALEEIPDGDTLVPLQGDHHDTLPQVSLGLLAKALLRDMLIRYEMEDEWLLTESAEVLMDGLQTRFESDLEGF